MSNIHVHIPENAIKIINDALLGIFAPTGTQYDFGDFIGWLNSWESRDSYARANGMMNYRFSVERTVHGRWYCCMKPKFQEIRGERASTTHTVVPGDTLYKIAERYHTTLENILMANPQIKNPSMIYPGDNINIR